MAGGRRRPPIGDQTTEGGALRGPSQPGKIPVLFDPRRSPQAKALWHFRTHERVARRVSAASGLPADDCAKWRARSCSRCGSEIHAAVSGEFSMADIVAS
jgi:hypothetical protein